MKSLFLKQKYDITGPYQNCSFAKNDPKEILELFKWKSGHPFQFGSKLNMDFIIVDNYKTFNWQKEENLVNTSRRIEIDHLYQEELPTVYDIDLNEYNLIFTSNPFLPADVIESNKEKLFITEPSEHWDKSLYEFINSYDLFWNYVPKEANYQIPQKKPNSAKKVFTRPYLTDHVFMRNLFSNKIKQKNFVFIGWRTSNLMSKEVKKAFQERLGEYKLEAIFTGGNPFDQSKKSDALTYWDNLAQSKYFIDVTCRLGQQLQDAASVSVINIGNAWRRDLIYKKNTINKIYKESEEITYENLYIFFDIIKRCETDKNYSNKVLLYQDSIILKDEEKTIKKLFKNRKLK